MNNEYTNQLLNLFEFVCFDLITKNDQRYRDSFVLVLSLSYFSNKEFFVNSCAKPQLIFMIMKSM